MVVNGHCCNAKVMSDVTSSVGSLHLQEPLRDFFQNKTMKSKRYARNRILS